MQVSAFCQSLSVQRHKTLEHLLEREFFVVDYVLEFSPFPTHSVIVAPFLKVECLRISSEGTDPLQGKINVLSKQLDCLCIVPFPVFIQRLPTSKKDQKLFHVAFELIRGRLCCTLKEARYLPIRQCRCFFRRI